MSRNAGSVSVDTFFACVNARLDLIDQDDVQACLDTYESVRLIFQSNNLVDIEAEIKSGKDYIKAQKRNSEEHKAPGRPVTPSVLAKVKELFPGDFDSFTNGTLEKTRRKQILIAARAVAKI